MTVVALAALLLLQGYNVPFRPQPAAGGTPAPDWTCAGGNVETWLLETTGWVAECDPGAGAAGCDLTDVGGVALDTTNFIQGSASGDFSGGSERLEDGNCAGWEGLTSDQSQTLWILRDSVSVNARVLSDSSNGLFTHARGNSGCTGSANCGRGYIDGVQNVETTYSLNSTSNWYLLCTSFDESGGEVDIWTGEYTGSDITWRDGMSDVGTDTDSGTPTQVRLGSFHVGSMDETTVWNVILTEAQCRKIAACGLDGSLCTCSGATYLDTGRQSDSTGLPDCDSAAP